MSAIDESEIKQDNIKESSIMTNLFYLYWKYSIPFISNGFSVKEYHMETSKNPFQRSTVFLSSFF